MNALAADTDPMLGAALAAAGAGLAVIYQQGKRAIAAGWNKGPALTADQLRATYRPGLNVAFRAGTASRIGGEAVVVLDVDLRGADEADMAAARAAYAELVGSMKPTVHTGGGGFHLYLRVGDDNLPCRPATILRQSTNRASGKPAWTVELLAEGHAVTMPPSVHPSGKAYAWANGGLGRIEGAPQSLLDALHAAPVATVAVATDAPEPLVVATEAEPYPLDALPAGIRAAVAEVQGFVQAPVPLVASSALGALSLAGQSLLDVKRADKLQGPCSLFLLTVANSGERKSTCDGFFTGAIRDFEAEQAEAAKPRLKEYRAEVAAWESKQAGIKDALRAASKKGEDTAALQTKLKTLEGEKKDSQRVAKLIRGDETPEHLAWTLAKDWPTGGVMSAEAGVVLGAHGMGKDTVMRNLALLNVLWDGGSLSIGRKTSESFEVRGARLAVALQVQEATLRAFFEQAGALARGSGFLARFLIAWPVSTQGHRPFKEAPTNWPALGGFNNRLAALLRMPQPTTKEWTLEPPLVAFTPEAHTAWVAFHDAIESELGTGGELHDVRDVASKVADNAARLAALFHLFTGEAGAISAECFAGAARIAAWHLSEARRFFGELALPPELADAVRLERWLLDWCREHGAQSVPRREAQRAGPVRDATRLADALDVLAAANRAQLVAEGKRKLIKPHPDLLREVKP